jgi:hypothetical protein
MKVPFISDFERKNQDKIDIHIYTGHSDAVYHARRSETGTSKEDKHIPFIKFD